MPVRAALLGEGRSDRGLVRILEKLCAREGVEIEIEWADERLEPFETDGGLAAKVQTLVEIDARYDILFLHRDADKAGRDARCTEISSACTSAGVSVYVPIVPVRETEAWLLLDVNAIREVVGNPKGKESLGLPKPDDVEDVSDPKERLKKALRQARIRGPKDCPRPMTKSEFGKWRADLLEQVNLDGSINHLSAWQALVHDTKTALAAFAATPG